MKKHKCLYTEVYTERTVINDQKVTVVTEKCDCGLYRQQILLGWMGQTGESSKDSKNIGFKS